jgi:hypothetical protein
MLPRDTISIAPVARAALASALEAVGDPRQQLLQRALAGQLGKSLQAQVVAKLSDGSFVVRVADTAARMQLPPGVQVGAELPMKLVAMQPRPTFQVGAGFAEAGPPLPEGHDPGAEPLAFHQQGPTARALSRAAVLFGNATPSAASDSSAPGRGEHASFSPAGKMLGSVLAAALEAEHPAKAVTGRAPVLPAPVADPAALAAALRHSVSKSGLFYESHVADWARGRITLAELATEPQMSEGAPRAQPTDPDTAGFINLQLVSHEQGQVAWQGQLWPGQAMHWEISRDAPDKDAPEGGAHDDQAAAWQSRLRLAFPLLGELAASITLAGGHVRVQLDAGEHTGELLRRHGERLATALEAAGTPLAALAIRKPEGAP